MSSKYMLTLYFDGSPTDKLTINNFARSTYPNINLSLLKLEWELVDI